MKKVTLLFLMLFGAIGFAQQTTLKGNGVDNPIYYNTHSKAKIGVLTESQQAADANLKNLGENKPFFINEQQNKPNAVTSKANGAVGAASQGLGVNNPIFTNDRGNRSTVPATQELKQNEIRPLERGLFGSMGFSSSGVEGRVSTNPPAGTASMIGTAHRPEASVVITHSATQNIVAGNSVTCNAGNIPDENSFFRDFNLAADFGITDEFNVTSAEFAVEDSGGPTNLTINIYSTSTAFPGGYPGSATLRGTASYVSGVADAGTVVSVPITATIPAGEIMIYELNINAGATFLWFPGSNADGQTGVSWIMSDACAISTPTDLADIGFPEQHMVMNIVGEEGGGGGSAYCIPEGTNSARFIDNFSTTGGSENISNMGSGFSAGGYGDFYDTDTVTQEQNGTVDFSVDIEGGTAGFRVWVDWNQDDEFDETQEVAYASSGYIASHTGSITVPADAMEGDTRMRIVSHWLSTSGDVDPCATGFTYGEFEDYKFTVTAGGGGGGGVCTTPVIEVNQDVDDTCMALIAPGIAQSYIPLESEAAGAGIKFTDLSTGLNVDLSLWDGLPNAGGTMLTSGTTDTDGTNWADVLWDDVVSVTVGNTYYIVVEGDPTLPCVAGSTNDPYPGGMTYANDFDPFPTFDYTFRTFSCDSGGGGGGTACSQDNPENAFENGFTTSKDGAQIIATDINVPADTDFSLEKMTVNIWMNPGETLTSADITFYDNASDLPGGIRNAYPAVVPVSQTVIGSNFGYDISEVVFEIAPEMLPGTEGSASRYWVSLYIDVSSGPGFIGSTSATIEGVNSAFSPDAGVTWNVNAGYDTVYLFEGTCEDIGGGGGDECNTTAPSNAFENGKSFTKNLGRIVANDITVVDGEDMLLESITFTAFIGSTGSGVNADNVDVFIYSDDGSGAPGAPYDTPQLSLVPTSQVLIGGNFGYDAWSIELDIADVNLVGQTGSDTTYWIGLSLEPTDGSNTFWEYSTAGVVGLAQAYDDGTGVGFIVEAGIEGVYSFDGTCSPTGGGGGCTPVSLQTLYDGGNNGSPGGAVYFDLTVEDSDIDVVSFDLNTEDTGAFTVDVYVFEGTYVGNQADPAMWGTAVATGSGDGAGVGLPSTATLDVPISMLANTTYAVALVFDATHSHTYTNGDGTNQNYSNGDISLDLGSASNTPFVDPIFDPRIWNGSVGYCVDGGGGGNVYCIPEGTNSSRFIDNFSTTGGSENISNMGSGFSDGGYGDFYDTHTVTQEQGETVQFSVDIEGGTAGFRVWVDWNQDGEFDVTEEVAYASNSYENSHTGTITVPADAMEGDTRMRIVSHWLSTSGDVDPCETGFTYGEFEDYKFTVEEGTGGGDECSTTAPSNAFENGKSFTKNLGRIVANDITVVDGEDMLLESITFTAFIGSTGSGVNADNVDVFIYQDDGTGAPGAPYGPDLTNLVPTSQVVIGTAFGYDAWSIELDIDDVNLVGQTGSDTTYWIGLSLEPTDGSNTFWEYSTAGVVGLAQAYDDGTGVGFIVEAGIEGVYSFDGNCTPLSVADNMLGGFTYYPNPTSGSLSLQSVSNIDSVSFFNLLGQKVMDVNINATTSDINLSGLNTGTYIMKVSVEGQIGTYKVLKN